MIVPITELIRTANAHINPEDSIAYLQKKDVVDRLYGKHPNCFMKLNRIGQDTSPYLLPICNRHAMEDPKVIGVSLKAIKQIIDNNSGNYDSGDLQRMLNQLQHKHNTLSKNVPKPAGYAAKKANITRMFQNIKSHLNSIRG